MSKIVLFDADGVMTSPQQLFSVFYASKYRLEQDQFTKFFETEWKDYVTGRKDLKTHVESNPDFWQWGGTPDELLKLWFETEDVRSLEMIKLVKNIRAAGVPCYLATEQEKYRAQYMKNVMFDGIFDGYFITAEIGYKKSDNRFFEEVISILTKDYPTINKSEIIFFDDSQSKVDAAKAVGIDACLFTGLESVTSKLGADKI